MNERMEIAIFELLAARAPGATICPSEAARKAATDDWRDQMELTRSVAVELVQQGRLEICQRGQIVPDPTKVKGPIRLRLPSPGK